ncbi:MAG: 5-(carboxyamino)imidazole ribonucleotide mutase [Bacteroidota bacterium]
MRTPETDPVIGIAMGSESDLPVMDEAAKVLAAFGVPFEMRVLSAHRTPQAMQTYAEAAHTRGLKVIIAGAGGAAHLPGMIAASTPLPVIGVPVPTRNLKGMDSLLSIVQMPGGVPVATVAIGGAKNAGLLALQILATGNPEMMHKIMAYKKDLISLVEDMDTRVQKHGETHQ